MKKYLFIVEKPSLLSVIKEVYDKNKSSLDYVADFVPASNPVSHILDTIRRVDVDDKVWEKLELKNIKDTEGFYIVNTEYSAKQLEKIRTLVSTGNYDVIVNAFDPGLYGQLSYESIKEKVGYSTPDKRMWFYSLTDGDVIKALKEFEDNSYILAKLLKEYEETGITC